MESNFILFYACCYEINVVSVVALSNWSSSDRSPLH